MPSEIRVPPEKPRVAAADRKDESFAVTAASGGYRQNDSFESNPVSREYEWRVKHAFRSARICDEECAPCWIARGKRGGLLYD